MSERTAVFTRDNTITNEYPPSIEIGPWKRRVWTIFGVEIVVERWIRLIAHD